MLLLIDCKDLMLSNPSSLNGHVERGLKKEKVSVVYMCTFLAASCVHNLAPLFCVRFRIPIPMGNT